MVAMGGTGPEVAGLRQALAERGSELQRAPLVSVIMPVKNVEAWVHESLVSVLGQSMRDLEVIVVDDGSTDDTVGIVKHLQSSDGRIKLIMSRGQGSGPARNLGIAAASGDFLAFADGDDIVPRDAYQVLTQQARMSGSSMVIGNHLVLEPQRMTARQESLPVYGETRTSITLYDDPRYLRDRICWNRIIRRSIWNKLGLSFSDSPRSNDILAMVHAFCAIPFDVIPLPVYVYRRRVGGTSMSASRLLPSSVDAHLAQEHLCADAVTRLQDPDVLCVYFEGILQQDLWAHGAHLFAEPALSDSSLDKVRERFRHLAARAPKEAWGCLSEEKRLVYAFIHAGEFAFAGAVLTRHDHAEFRRHLAGAPLAALIESAHHHADNVNGVLTAAFRTVSTLVTEPGRLDTVDTAFLQRTVAELRDAKAAGIPKERLSATERALVLSSGPWTLDVVKELAQQGNRGETSRGALLPRLWNRVLRRWPRIVAARVGRAARTEWLRGR